MNKSNNNKEQLLELAVEEYLNTPKFERSLTKIGNKYGIKRQLISKILKERGYEVINYLNRLRLNETIFDIIDTEEKAYWLGFLYADGCVDSTGYRIEIHLALKDLDHLEKFRKFILLENEIRTGVDKKGYKFCHLSFRNKHMWQALCKVGCVPVKTLILTFPKLSYFSDKKLIKHFIRGYVDGDGCLTIYPDNKRNTLRTILKMLGTKSFLTTVNKIFWNKGYLRLTSTPNYISKAYSLEFSEVSSRKFARILYLNATIYLERKYNKYLEFCRLEEESSRRLSSKIGESCDGNTEVISEIAQGSETLLSVESE